MTTTELIKILQDNEKGGISHKSRQISLTVNGRYLPNPQITLSSTGDGIAGPEIDFDVDGEWLESEANGIDDVLDKIRAEIDNALSDGMIHKKTVLGIIDKYKAESGGSCEPMTKTLGIELRHNPSELVELLEEQYKSGEISPIVISESLITLFRMLGEKRIVESEGQE